MGRYDPDLRLLVLEPGDEPNMPVHFANARLAWAEQREVVDSSYRYEPDKDGVWGGSVGVPKRDYLWPRETLEGETTSRD